MKKIFFLSLLLYSLFLPAQNRKIDSLRLLLKGTLHDTSVINNLNSMAMQYMHLANYDSTLSIANNAYSKAKKAGYNKGEGRAVNIFGLVDMQRANYKGALKNYHSAIKILENTEDKVGLANSWHNIGYTYYNMGDYANALKNYFISLDIRKKNSDLLGIAYSHNNIGLAYMQMGNYAGAVQSYSMGLKISQQLGDGRVAASCYNNIGDIYQNQGNYPLALKNYLMALKFFEKNHDNSTLLITYVTIGSMYYTWKKYPEAIDYSNKALKLAKEIDDQAEISGIRNLLGLIALDKGQYDEALKNFKANLDFNKEAGDNATLAISYENIANVYFKLGRYDEARQHDTAALALYIANGDKIGIALVLLNIGSIDMKLKRYHPAEEHFLKSLAMARELDHKVAIKEASEYLSKLYEATGNKDKALKYYKDYAVLKDSLFNESNVKKIVELEMNYDFDKKEAALKSEQEKKDLKTADEKRIKEYQLLGVVILLFIVILIGWLFIRQNKLKAGQQAMQLEQQLLRSQMNPHFIFNSLIAIESFIYNNEPRAAGKYLSGFARLMRLILENSRREVVTLAKEIETLENYLDLQKLRYDNAFDYTIHVAKELETDFVELPPMLAQPFIENAIEHGLRDVGMGGLIEIKFGIKDKMLMLEIKDNGVGFSQKKDAAHQSLATTITKERIGLINKKSKEKASFTITEAYPLNERKGVLVTFMLPVL